MARMRHSKIADGRPLSGEEGPCSGHRRMAQSDPKETKPGPKSRSAAVPAVAECAILSVERARETSGSETP
jgi:hypothetical protein